MKMSPFLCTAHNRRACGAQMSPGSFSSVIITRIEPGSMRVIPGGSRQMHERVIVDLVDLVSHRRSSHISNTSRRFTSNLETILCHTAHPKVYPFYS